MNRRAFLKSGLVGGTGLALGAVGLERASAFLWPESVSIEPNTSFWARRSQRFGQRLTRDLEVDVVVVGAGITGLSTAIALCRQAPRQRIAVLEAHLVGNGASGRSGGFLLPLPTNEWLHIDSTPELHRRLYELTETAMREEVALFEAAGFDGATAREGFLQTLRPQDVDQARDYVEKVNAVGIPLRLWSDGEVRSALGTGDGGGGLYFPFGGHLDPMQLTHAMGAAAARAGAAIFEESPVASIEEGNKVCAHLVDGPSVTANAVVLATNAYSTQLGYFRNAIVPIQNYMAITPPLGAELSGLGLTRPIPSFDCRTKTGYWGVTPANRLFIGGYCDYSFNNGSDTNNQVSEAVSVLRRSLARLYPSIGDIPFEAAWGGVVDITPDRTPSVGVTGANKNVYYALGYNGHGMVMAFLAGKIIADLATGHAGGWGDIPFVNRAMCFVPNEPFRWLGAKAVLNGIDILEPPGS